MDTTQQTREETGSSGPGESILRSKYEYQPLGEGQIRVLTLFPANKTEDDLHGELHHVQLSPELKFEAVSYVWGEPIFSVTLRISDTSIINITKNLSDALRRFRKPGVPRTLWVDALCINQSEVQEKNRQVQLMGQIYQYAQTVLAWLGDVPDAKIDTGSIELVGSLAFVGRGMPFLRPGTSIYLMDDLTQLEDEARRNVGGNWPLVFKLSRMDSDLNPCGIRPLYESPWFTRMWIVQEATLARSLVLHLGSVELNWHDFERMCVLIYLFVETGNPFNPEHWQRFCSFCWPVVHAAHEVKGASRKKPQHAVGAWFKSLTLCGSRDCGDDRDRIYALLGLLPPQAGIVINPDYAKHTAEIYTEVAGLALKNGILQHLYSAGAWRRKDFAEHGNTCRPDCLPSWVPDHRCSPMDDSSTWWMQNGYGDYELIDRDPQRLHLYRTNDPHVFGFDGSRLDFVAYTWSFKDLDRPMPSPPDASWDEDTQKYHQTRNAVKNLLTELEALIEGDSYIGVEPWKIACLKALFASCDSNAMWQGYCTAAGGFDPKEFGLSDALQLYLENILEDDALLSTTGDAPKKDAAKPDLSEGMTRVLRMLHNQMGVALRNFTFLVTAKGLFGIAPVSSCGCRTMDQVVFIDCAKIPFLLREASGCKAQVLVSPCYIQGLMGFSLENRREVGHKGRIMLI